MNIEIFYQFWTKVNFLDPIDELIAQRSRIAIEIQAFYNFDITTPLVGYRLEKNDRDTLPLSAIGQNYATLLRISLKSEQKRIQL